MFCHENKMFFFFLCFLKITVAKTTKTIIPKLSVWTTYKDNINYFWYFQVSHRDVETEKRLRKDLKRTKALLADAQIMLDHLKNNAPSKREIAQLKNQVCFSAPLVSVDNTSYMRSSRKHTFHLCVFACVLFTARGIRVHMCCCGQGPKVNGSRDRGPPCTNGRHIQIQADGKSVCVW